MLAFLAPAVPPYSVALGFGARGFLLPQANYFGQYTLDKNPPRFFEVERKLPGFVVSRASNDAPVPKVPA